MNDSGLIDLDVVQSSNTAEVVERTSTQTHTRTYTSPGWATQLDERFICKLL